MSALGSTGHFQALSRVLKQRFSQNVLSAKALQVEDGLAEYSITWVQFNASTNLRLNVDDQILEIATTSQNLQLPEGGGDNLAVFLSKLQADVPFGHMQVDTAGGQVYYRSGQLLGGIGDSEELIYFHLFLHSKLFPLLDRYFTLALSYSFDDRSIDNLLDSLRKSIAEAKLDL